MRKVERVDWDIYENLSKSQRIRFNKAESRRLANRASLPVISSRERRCAIYADMLKPLRIARFSPEWSLRMTESPLSLLMGLPVF